MEEQLIRVFREYPQLALLISLAVSIVVAILGLLPSFFITAANILFFGFWQGTLVSFAGEALGAAAAFLLYRKGFQKQSQQGLQRFPKVQRLMAARGSAAFWMILSFRLIPFIPSGLVTFAAAVGQVSFPLFLLASSVGKLPALLMEAYSVNAVIDFGWQGKTILVLSALVILYLVIKKKKKS